MQQQSSKVKLLPIAKNSSKLKEDITSLGSDDSGICGSDSSAETRPKGSEETIATEDAKSEPEEEQPKPNTSTPAGDTAAETVAKETCVPKKDNLLRFMESSMFQAPLAISYLFTTKELGVQTYIANKLFTFPEHEVDFYLPQLISMYIHIPELASLIYPYLKHRYALDTCDKTCIDH
jgi:phosphatidylinositol 4-kinase B